jgi:hypothetical protein
MTPAAPLRTTPSSAAQNDLVPDVLEIGTAVVKNVEGAAAAGAVTVTAKL